MTTLLLYFSLGVTAAVVLVLVVYLVGIIIALWGTRNSLAQLAGGLIAVRDQTRPLAQYMGDINVGLVTLLQGLLAVNADLAAIVRVAQGK